VAFSTEHYVSDVCAISDGCATSDGCAIPDGCGTSDGRATSDGCATGVGGAIATLPRYVTNICVCRNRSINGIPL
jgi:hypothetical protein